MVVDGLSMRKAICVKSLIPVMIGGLLVVLGILTRTSATTIIYEKVLNNTYSYGFLGEHECEVTADLSLGAYELRYNFSSTETIKEFYVSVLDPDGYEIKSLYGPPAVYQPSSANVTFETQKSGQHTFILGGRWISVHVDLFKSTQSTKIDYPYEIVLYVGLPLLTGGAIAGIFGALLKEKPTYWLDKI
jgi:hypothetical protein